jgi:hypothetical protein
MLSDRTQHAIRTNRANGNLPALGALLAWTAVGSQLYLTVHKSLTAGDGIAHGLVIYFGYFTITSNIFAALCFTAAATGSTTPFWSLFRRAGVVTCATACMIVVGLSYFVLLRKIWNPQGAQYVVDVLLHYVMPPVTLLFWWIVTPPRAVRWSVRQFMTYPLAYLVYVLVRAPLVGSYPYYFIDANALGLPRALLNCAGITALYLVVLVALLLANNRGPSRVVMAGA